MKIKASEVRIGNWVQAANGKQFQVSAETIQIMSDHNTDISGVELSPEILIKAGFVDNGQQIYDMDRFTIRKYKSSWSVYYVNVWIVDLQFLHTFMNLFFALTQTELKIEI